MCACFFAKQPCGAVSNELKNAMQVEKWRRDSTWHEEALFAHLHGMELAQQNAGSIHLCMRRRPRMITLTGTECCNGGPAAQNLFCSKYHDLLQQEVRLFSTQQTEHDARAHRCRRVLTITTATAAASAMFFWMSLSNVQLLYYFCWRIVHEESLCVTT